MFHLSCGEMAGCAFSNQPYELHSIKPRERGRCVRNEEIDRRMRGKFILAELPGLLHELPEDLVVFAEEPWIPGANAMLRRLEPDFSVSEDIKKSTF